MGTAQIVATVAGGRRHRSSPSCWRCGRSCAMIAVIRLGQPDPARFADKGHPHQDHAGRDARPHPDAQVERGRRGALVRDGRASSCCSCWCSRRTSRSSTPRAACRSSAHWVVYGLVTECIGVLGLVGILVLIVDPAAQPAGHGARPVPVHRLDDVAGLLRRVRSSSAVLICGFLIRGLQGRHRPLRVPGLGHPGQPRASARCCRPARPATTVVALVKIVISMTWLIMIALNVTMGVAWHRFLAFPNIFFKRDAGEAGRLRPRRAAADDVRAASRSTSRRPTRRRTSSASPRSSSSPGRACSTSPPARSAAAASRSARPGTPASRCRPSCSC